MAETNDLSKMLRQVRCNREEEDVKKCISESIQFRTQQRETLVILIFIYTLRLIFSNFTVLSNLKKENLFQSLNFYVSGKKHQQQQINDAQRKIFDYITEVRLFNTRTRNYN